MQPSDTPDLPDVGADPGPGVREIHVAVNGSDTNAGTTARPFAGLPAAQAAVRALLVDERNVNVRVVVHQGTYVLDEPLVFTPADSADDGFFVCWSAADGDQVTLSGGPVRAAAWTVHSGSIMKTRLESGLDFDQLFVGGERRILARYPDFVPGDRLQGYANDAISPERLAGWANPTTGYVRGLHDLEWGGNSFEVLGVDDDGSAVLKWTGDNQRGSGLHSQYRMVENIFEELDAENEWFYDKRDGWLYFWPRSGEDLDAVHIQLAMLPELIRCEGASPDLPVRNLVFEGFRLSGTHRTLFGFDYEPLQLGDWSIVRKGALAIKNACGITVRACSFDQVGGNAVFMDGYCKHVVVEGNSFNGSGASDVSVVGSPEAVRNASVWGHEVRRLTDSSAGPQSEDYPRDVTIRFNHMRHMGVFEKQSAGVQISMSRRVTVERNTIHDGPRAAININDGTWGGHRILGNDIYRMVLETGDHGPINSWGRDRFWPLSEINDAQRKVLVDLDALEDTVISGNRIWHDREWAIDLDDGSSKYLIENNLLLNAGVKLREGFHRRVCNNIFVNGGVHSHVSYEENSDEVSGNLFLTKTPYYFIQADPSHSGIIYDDNFFWNNGEVIEIVSEDWMAAGHDRHSVIIDPRLEGATPWEDPHVDLVRLSSDSELPASGFDPDNGTDSGSPGVTSTFPPIDWDRKGDHDGNAPIPQIWLGALVTEIYSQALASSVGLYGPGGVYLQEVPFESAAAQAGLRAGDVVRTIGTVTVWDTDQALQMTADGFETEPEGDRVTLGIWRNQAAMDISIQKASRT